MHGIFRLLALLAAFCIGPRVLAQQDAIMMDGHRVHPTRILVKYAPQATAQAAAPTYAAAGLRVARAVGRDPRLVLLDVEANVRVPAIAGNKADALRARIQQLKQSGLFDYVEPDHQRKWSLVPTDTSFQDGTLWGLRNNGQAGGVAGADIGVTNAWDITVGATNVIVCVLDSGVRYTHQDLASQMWRNPGEIPGNGLDDDNDGYVDNVFGINAVSGTGDPFDDFGHGTHVAGTIGAAPNNGFGHVGVAWNSRLMAVKCGDAFGPYTSAIIEGIDFAIARGVKVINASFGGYSFNQAEFDAFLRARNAGILVVAAAGNDGINIDLFPSYPATFPLDNIICVAALDRRDGIASFSNFGRNSVHLGAPGVEISSTYYTADNSYQQLDGTSMAAPHVAGVAALVFSLTNSMTYTEVRNRILFTAVPVSALATNTTQGGRVNAYRALTTVEDGLFEVTVTPAPGSTLLAGSTVPLTVEVTDLRPVANAIVSGTVPGVFTNEVFYNNGAPPDAIAGDNRHSFNLSVPLIPTNRLELRLIVDGSSAGKTNFTNTYVFRTATVPLNDNFPPLAKVPDNGGVVVGDNTFGSLQFGEPVHAGVATVAKSVWWNFAPTNTGLVLVDTAGSAFDTVVAVYVGNTLTNLTSVAATNDAGNIQQGYVKFIATNGVTYRIVVASATATSAGAVRLKVRFNGEPDTQAPVVAVTNLVSGPLSVTNPSSGSIVTNASLTLSGTAADLGADAIGVSRVMVRLNNGLPVVTAGTTNWTLPLFLSPGTNVIHISAADFSENLSVPISFQVIYRVFDPFNDVWANALQLSGASGGTTTNNANATLEPGEPLHAGKQGGRSVWYFFTAPADGVLFLTTSNSTFDTLLAVYTGTRVDRLAVLSANDDEPSGSGVHSEVQQAVRAGTTYYVAVDGLAGGSGTIILSYAFTAVPLYDLTVTATSGGVAFPATGSFPSNSVVDVTAVASNGFNFVTWTGSQLSLDNPLRVTVRGATTLNAVFAPVLLADGFETGALRSGIGWSTNNSAGIAPWSVQLAGGLATNSTIGGLYHMRSGAITHNQTTVVRLVANCRAGAASFAYRVSAEEFGPTVGDFFEFYLNGTRQVRTNGQGGWRSHTFTVTGGTNTLEWRYLKDASSSGGLDAAFIDSLDLPLIEPVNLAVPVRFVTNSVARVSGGFQFRIEGQTNQTYVIQASSDLANWVSVSTNFAPYGLIQFSEPQSLTNTSRYYRAILP